MPVSIKIVNKDIDKTNHECQAALALKTLIENSFRGSSADTG